jgi:hypothetical protein
MIQLFDGELIIEDRELGSRRIGEFGSEEMF